jgi:26S proteasome regulatory subunit N3
VIKSGLRRINIAYSTISLKDISEKLGIAESDIEFIVSKAIRDGVIEATVDHDAGTMRSRTLDDVYTTYEPQQNFHKRIVLSMELRNDCVRALQYPEEKKEEAHPAIDSITDELAELTLSDDDMI